MSIFVGNIDITTTLLADSNIKAVYVGDKLVWQSNNSTLNNSNLNNSGLSSI